MHNRTVNYTKDWLNLLKDEDIVATKKFVKLHHNEDLNKSITSLKKLIASQQWYELEYLDGVINSTEITTAKDQFCLLQNKLKKILAGTSIAEDTIMSNEERQEVKEEKKELKKEEKGCRDTISNRTKSKTRNLSNTTNSTDEALPTAASSSSNSTA